MTRRCTLHLGMHKTGSTSIQQAMRSYDDGQTAYLQLGNPNHSLPLAAMFSSREAASKPAQAAAAAAAREALTAQLAESRRNIVISGEGLSTFPDEASIRALVDHLAPHFTEIRAFAYIREPRGMMRSAFQQRLKVHGSDFAPDRLYPNYKRRFGLWLRILGRSQVDFAPFARDQFRNGDLITDFAARLGLPLPFRGLSQVHTNESLSAEAVAILFAFRTARGTPADIAHVMAGNPSVVTKLKAFGTSRFDLSDAAIAPVLAAKSEDIAWMEAQLGQPLVSPAPAPDTILFGSAADLCRYAETCLPAFAAWFPDAFPQPAAANDRIVELMDLAYARAHTAAVALPGAGRHSNGSKP